MGHAKLRENPSGQGWFNAQIASGPPYRFGTMFSMSDSPSGASSTSATFHSPSSPAVRAAGFVKIDDEGKSKPTNSPYSLRHTYASWAIAAGIGLFELSRLMGTSVEQIDRTYGHLLPDSLDRARTALDSFGAVQGKEIAYE